MKQTSSPQNQAFLLFGLLFLFSFSLFAQVGIGNTDPNASSLLDIGDGTNANTKGLLIPRVNIPNLALPGPVTSPATGLLVYNTRPANAGFYYWDGSRWMGIDGGKNWQLAGNAGTLPATNFIGTTDNVNLRFRTNNADQFEITTDGKLRAFKAGTATEPLYSWSSSANMGMYAAAANVLAFSTASTERMRILANGQMVVNLATAPSSTDRFSVYGAADEDAISGYGTGNGSGVYGSGVFGISGVGTTYGNLGVVDNAAGAGIRAANSNGNGTGLIASGNNLTGNYLGNGSGVAGTGFVGVYGNGTAYGSYSVGSSLGSYSSGGSYGSYSTVNSDTGMGVRAVNENAMGTGLLGTGNNATGSYLENGSGLSGTGDTGVYGRSSDDTGTGIIGVDKSSTVSVVSPEGSGLSGTGAKLGVFGYAGQGTVDSGNRGNAAGRFVLDADGDPTTTTGHNGNRASAILAGFDNVSPRGIGLRDSYYGGYFSGGSESSGTPTYAYVGMRYRTNGNGDGTTGGSGQDYKIIGSGSVSTLINDENGTPRVLFAPEAPEVVFQDYGIGQLINGEARILIDPVFKRGIHVDERSPLKVFVTLEGDCNGVYVTNKSADGFTVRELQGGRSNVPFSWQLVATRADTKNNAGEIVSKHVGVRLPEGPGPLSVKANKLETLTLKTEDVSLETKTQTLKNIDKPSGKDIQNHQLQGQLPETNDQKI